MEISPKETSLYMYIYFFFIYSFIVVKKKMGKLFSSLYISMLDNLESFDL